MATIDQDLLESITSAFNRRATRVQKQASRVVEAKAEEKRKREHYETLFAAERLLNKNLHQELAALKKRRKDRESQPAGEATGVHVDQTDFWEDTDGPALPPARVWDEQAAAEEAAADKKAEGLLLDFFRLRKENFRDEKMGTSEAYLGEIEHLCEVRPPKPIRAHALPPRPGGGLRAPAVPALVSDSPCLLLVVQTTAGQIFGGAIPTEFPKLRDLMGLAYIVPASAARPEERIAHALCPPEVKRALAEVVVALGQVMGLIDSKRYPSAHLEPFSYEEKHLIDALVGYGANAVARDPGEHERFGLLSDRPEPISRFWQEEVRWWPAAFVRIMCILESWHGKMGDFIRSPTDVTAQSEGSYYMTHEKSMRLKVIGRDFITLAAAVCLECSSPGCVEKTFGAVTILQRRDDRVTLSEALDSVGVIAQVGVFEAVSLRTCFQLLRFSKWHFGVAECGRTFGDWVSSVRQLLRRDETAPWSYPADAILKLDTTEKFTLDLEGMVPRSAKRTRKKAAIRQPAAAAPMDTPLAAEDAESNRAQEFNYANEQAAINAFKQHPAVRALPETQQFRGDDFQSIKTKWCLAKRGSAQYDQGESRPGHESRPSHEKSREKGAKAKAGQFFAGLYTDADWDAISVKTKVGTGVLLQMRESYECPGICGGNHIYNEDT
jgi:hypothetical protein